MTCVNERSRVSSLTFRVVPSSQSHNENELSLVVFAFADQEEQDSLGMTVTGLVVQGGMKGNTFHEDYQLVFG
ncbi:unnamed protein product [Eruca vesicaria subsp. sativa]|uniref:Uncharacterized protein n=1 Tax=Eruca vesicaria subsp. sativa TaxID=29727 RepID=A0ABC8JIW2_ERUVS|nr:unnamed protein product [Eruca vesicaria subsp. sativa]